MFNDLKREINYDKSKKISCLNSSNKAFFNLEDKRIYDAMYTERYMDYRGMDGLIKNKIETCVWKNFLGEIGQPHWVNSSMVEQTIRGDRIQNFANVSYTMIHGMNDDNVHFKTSADMQKLLSKNDIEFDAIVSDINQFYL